MIRNLINIAAVILIIILVILQGCSDDIIKPPPPLDPEIFADISGYDSLHFESDVQTLQNPYNPPSMQLFLNGSSTINGKVYGLSILLIYLDGNLHTGTFHLRNSDTNTVDYAVGGFIIGKGKNEVKFISDSGTVEITEIKLPVVNGTFTFYGSDTNTVNTKHIIIKNGILKVKN